MNRTRRSYHSGETADLEFVIGHLKRRHPSSPLLLAGASLGGNVLLKYRGERAGGLDDTIRGAVAVSVPFDLGRASRHIGKGFAQIYQRHFLRSLRRKALRKLTDFPDIVPVETMTRAVTLYDFDDVFTAPAHGFTDADDYYGRSSSLQWIRKLSINTLLLSAVDDPFLPAQVLDEVRQAALQYIRASGVHAKGGHVGFVGGTTPFTRHGTWSSAQVIFLQHSSDDSTTHSRGHNKMFRSSLLFATTAVVLALPACSTTGAIAGAEHAVHDAAPTASGSVASTTALPADIASARARLEASPRHGEW